MRPKVVFWTIVLAVGFLGSVFVLIRTPNRPNQPAADIQIAPLPIHGESQSRETIEKPILTEKLVHETAPVPKTVSDSRSSPSANHSDASAARESSARTNYVRQRKAHLSELSMKSDPASLNILLSELQNPDREIRMAALDAVIQFDDRAAIPRLEEIAKQTEDAGERKAIEDAIEYMKLPSLAEHLAQRKAELAAIAGTNQIRITSSARSKAPRKTSALPLGTSR